MKYKYNIKNLDCANCAKKIEEKLNKEEMKALYLKSGLPLKRFFNTSGMKYRELKFKRIN